MNRLIYIAHAYAADPIGNSAAMRAICRAVLDSGDVPICPALYLPTWLDEATEREAALEVALHLLALCREIRVYGDRSPGVDREIAHALACRIPVVFVAEC